jgi:hypothetical protein
MDRQLLGLQDTFNSLSNACLPTAGTTPYYSVMIAHLSFLIIGNIHISPRPRHDLITLVNILKNAVCFTLR